MTKKTVKSKVLVHRSYKVSELPEYIIKAIAASRMDGIHNHLNVLLED